MEFCFSEQRRDPSLAGLTPDQLVETCAPRWTSQPAAQAGKSSWKGMDSYGRSLSELQDREKKRLLEQREMEEEVRATVELALQCRSLPDQQFYLVQTGVFCLTAEGGVVPAELSIARISLRRGLQDMYHTFIEPGPIPKGYRADCYENSKATHKIPLDLNLMNGNYEEIIEEILEFLLPSDAVQSMPRLFTLPRHYRQTQLVLDWLKGRAGGELADLVTFKLASLPVLLFHLMQDSAVEVGESERSSTAGSCSAATNSSWSSAAATDGRERVPTVSLAEAQLERDLYIYVSELDCDWHRENVETMHCTSASLARWSFMLFSLACPRYRLPMLAGVHYPLDAEVEGTVYTASSTAASSSQSADSFITQATTETPAVDKEEWRRASIRLSLSMSLRSDSMDENYSFRK